MKTAMHPNPRRSRDRQAGNILFVVLVLTGVLLIAVGTALTRSQTNVRLNERYSQYQRSVAAAESATEKVLARVSRDYLLKGEKEVVLRLGDYRKAIPQTAESQTWSNWEFQNSHGEAGLASVDLSGSAEFVEISSIYKGLRGFVTPLAIVAQARQLNSSLGITAGVRQEIELVRIPIFQFAMFSSLDMEISCGQPLHVTGRVHSNKQLYVEPDSDLTFDRDVTAVGNILFQRSPLDTRTAPKGTATYLGRKDSKVAALYLPIGADNTVTTLENTPYVFTLADFAFADPAETTPDSLDKVKIVAVPLVSCPSETL